MHESVFLDDGAVQETHLCELCSQTGGDTPPAGIAELLSKAALDSVKPRKKAPTPPERTCSACGLTYRQFRTRGRMGCSDCYAEFREFLDPLLEKVHGGTRHVGKQPGRFRRVGGVQLRRLIQLRRQLAEAVSAERYEEAARIRDELAQAEEEADAVEHVESMEDVPDVLDEAVALPGPAVQDVVDEVIEVETAQSTESADDLDATEADDDEDR